MLRGRRAAPGDRRAPTACCGWRSWARPTTGASPACSVRTSSSTARRWSASTTIWPACRSGCWPSASASVRCWPHDSPADKVEYGLIPLGGLGIAVLSLLFWWISPGIVGMFVLMLLLGVASGFIVVPLNALIQWRAPAGSARRDHRARQSLCLRRHPARLAQLQLDGDPVVGQPHHSAGQLGGDLRGHGCLGDLADAGSLPAPAAWSCWRTPPTEFASSTSSTCRETGGALLVPNHVSFIDGLFLIASTDRPVRFIVEEAYFENWLGEALPESVSEPSRSAGDAGPRKVLRALRDAWQVPRTG